MMQTGNKLRVIFPVIAAGLLPVFCGWLLYQTTLMAHFPLSLRFAVAESAVMGFCYFVVPAFFLRKNFPVLLIPALIFLSAFVVRTWHSFNFVSVFLFGLPAFWIVKNGFMEDVTAFSRRSEKTPYGCFLVFGGVLCGALLLGHLFVTLSFVSRASLKPIIVKEAVYWLFYGLLLSSFYEEFFYRGFLIKKFNALDFTFWEASLSSAFLYVLKYAALPRIYESPAVAFGTLFYAALVAVVSSLVLRKTGNLMPCIAISAIFYAGANFVK